MKQVLRRAYPVSDDKLLVFAGVYVANIISKYEYFSDFNNSIFHIDFPKTITDKVAKIRAIESDNFVLQSQAKETDDVVRARNLLTKLLIGTKIAIKKRFSKKSAIFNRFRTSEISTVSQSSDKLIHFTVDFIKRVEDYQTDLEMVGVGEEELNGLKDALTYLIGQREEQLAAIQNRPNLTTDRINSSNELWEILLFVKEAAYHIFKDLPEIKALFKLPSNRSGNSSDEDTMEIDTSDVENESQQNESSDTE